MFGAVVQNLDALLEGIVLFCDLVCISVRSYC